MDFIFDIREKIDLDELIIDNFAAQALEKIGEVPEIFLRQAFEEILEK